MKIFNCYLKRKISINLINGILNLKEDDFDKINDFINIINEMKANDNIKEFNYILKTNNIKKIFNNLFLNTEYKTIIIKYKSIIEMLIEKNIFNEFIENTPIELLDYLTVNYSKKMQYKEIINKINLGHIKELYFMPELDFEIKGSMELSVSKYTDGETNVCKYHVTNGIYSDGDVTWLHQSQNNIYSYNVVNANYIIQYSKGKLINIYNPVKMIVKNFDFDVNTIPSFEDLNNISVCPNMDYNLLNNRINAINIIENLESTSNLLYNLLNNSEELLNQFIDNPRMEILINQKENLELMKQELLFLSKETYEDFIEQKIVSLDDIQKIKNTKNR